MKVLKIFDVPRRSGEVGIEIELEGTDLPAGGIPSWNCVRDGSLRGNSMEYVLKLPCKRENVSRVLDKLKGHLSDSTVTYSGRAGVHIHINVQELQMQEVMNLVCLYLIFEQSLVEFCGEGRAGNLFCLRATDANGMIDMLRSACETQDWRILRSDRLRYAALNVNSLSRYGSLEFRAMRSTTDMEVLEQWASMLLALKDYSLCFSNPQAVIEASSLKGPEVMFEEIFGADTPLKFCYAEAMEGVRNAQHIAYSTDEWKESKPAVAEEYRLDAARHVEAPVPPPPPRGARVDGGTMHVTPNHRFILEGEERDDALLAPVPPEWAAAPDGVVGRRVPPPMTPERLEEIIRALNEGEQEEHDVLRGLTGAQRVEYRRLARLRREGLMDGP